MYSYDRRVARVQSAESLFKAMKESVDSLLEARVKLRRVHEMLSEVARDASGVTFKDTYENKDVRKVSKDLYDLDHTIGEAFRDIERLERDLRKKVV